MPKYCPPGTTSEPLRKPPLNANGCGVLSLSVNSVLPGLAEPNNVPETMIAAVRRSVSVKVPVIAFLASTTAVPVMLPRPAPAIAARPEKLPAPSKVARIVPAPPNT